MSTVPFTEKDVKSYLDDCIVFWREKKRTVDGEPVMAVHYIDAFQSVRMSLFGELLPMDEVGYVKEEKEEEKDD